MTHTAEGRFCAHCQKTVIDFTKWTDAALYNFFSKNTGNVCGTFYQDQLNRPINIPYQPHSRLYRLTVALGLTLVFTQTPEALAQNNPPKTEQTSLFKQQAGMNDHPGEIGGKVLSEKKEPFPNAIIQVFHDSILIESTITDIDGNYTIKPLVAGYYNILITHPLYFGIEIQGAVVSPGNRTTQNAILLLKGKNDSPALKIVQYRKPLVDGGISANRHIYAPAGQSIEAQMPLNIAIMRMGDIASRVPGVDSSEKAPFINMDNPDKRTFTRDEIDHMPE